MIGTPGSSDENAAGPPPLPGCTEDAAAALKQMFVDMSQGSRLSGGQDPVERPVFLKPHGAARGVLTVDPDLPPDLRLGFLRSAHEQGTGGLAAWVRFSSDTVPGSPDLKTTLGVGIKLFNVPGPKLLEGETGAGTQDLLLQNHDVFFVDTAQDMCEFTRAGVVDGNYEPYLAAHPVTRQILDEMAEFEASVLTATYWGVLPYAFGSERFVKYKLVPAGCEPADPEAVPADEDPTYLGADLRHRLGAGTAAFDLMLQFRADPQRMPLDRATVRWEESESEPVRVARLTLQKQDITARGQAAYGENLAYNPWHSLVEHRPVGSISEVRRTVYQASAELRRDVNGIPAVEPGPARRPRHPDRPCRHPPRDRRRPGRRQRGRVRSGPRGRSPGRAAHRKLQGRHRCPETPGRPVPRLRLQRRRRAGRRTDRRQRGAALDRSRRQQEGRLVPVPAGPRHPGGGPDRRQQPPQRRCPGRRA